MNKEVRSMIMGFSKKQFNGSSLVLVIMIMGIALVAAMSVALVSVRERKASIGAGKSDVAYHNADTGIEVVMKELLKGNYTNVIEVFLPAPPAVAGIVCDIASGNIIDTGGSFSVELQDGSHTKSACSAALVSGVRYIRSTGTSGQYQRSVSAPVFQSNFTQVAAGTSHSLALDGSGNVWAWGDNSRGQLGVGDIAGRSYPVKVKNSTGGFLPGISQISAAGNYSLAVDYNGNVWAWGDNANYQLGDGTAASTNLPVNVEKSAGVNLGLLATEKIQKAVGCGDFSLALDVSGNVWSWGKAGDQLGRTGASEYAKNVEKDAGGILDNVLDIACGNDNGVAISDGYAGIVWVWGDNQKGQAGTGSASPSSNSKAITNSISGISKVAAGGDSILALKNDGKVLAWGDNDNEQLGINSSSSPILSSTEVSGLSGIDAISIGQNASVFVNAGIDIRAAGKRVKGFMGDLTCGDNGKYDSPVEIKSGGNSISASSASVSAAGNHALLIDANGKVKSWGVEANCVLGNGSSCLSTSCKSSPEYVLF